MFIEIVSPEKTIFTGDVSSVYLPGSEGFFQILDNHAPMKKRTVRGNQKPHMSKVLRKAIMVRSYYKNKANKTGNLLYKTLYRKQKNYVVNLKVMIY